MEKWTSKLRQFSSFFAAPLKKRDYARIEGN